MLSYPRTPSRRPLEQPFSPFYPNPTFAPFSSPTPAPCDPLVDRLPSEIFSHTSKRTLSAAGTLLHLASSPGKAPSDALPHTLSLRPSGSSFGSSALFGSRTHSHAGSGAFSQSTQSTFLQSPLPVTPSRALDTSKRAAKLDTLDISTHLFSSPFHVFASPRYGELLQDPLPAFGMSPVFHQGEEVAVEHQDSLKTMPSSSPFGDPQSAGLPHKLPRDRSRPRLRHFKQPQARSFDELLYGPSSSIDTSDLPQESRTGSTSAATSSRSSAAVSAASRPFLLAPAVSLEPSRPLGQVSRTSSVVLDKQQSPHWKAERSASPSSPLSSLSSPSSSPQDRSSSPHGYPRFSLPPFYASSPPTSQSSQWKNWQPSPPKTRARQRSQFRPMSGPSVAEAEAEGSNRRQAARKTRLASAATSEDPLPGTSYPSVDEGSSSGPRKRRRCSPTTVSIEPRKKARKSPPVSADLSDVNSSSDAYSRQESPKQASQPNIRTFPSHIPIRDDFPLLYRRFSVPIFGSDASGIPNPDESLFMSGPSVLVVAGAGAVFNPPRSPYDLYTPRVVKGRGPTKVGICPICVEPRSRGGEGKKVWLSMKFSAFNYHMQYAHGLSPNGTPFSPPTAFQRVARPNATKHEKTSIEQGKCHKCRKWVAVEGIKDVDVKVKEIFWWKHAAACHQGSTIAGEGGYFVGDDYWHALQVSASPPA